MRRPDRPAASGLALATASALLAVLAACGVPTDDQPRAISSEQAPEIDDSEEGTTAAVTDDAALFLTRVDGANNRLVPVDAQVPVGASSTPTPATAIETLLSYTPDETLRAEGYASRIPPDTALASPPELNDGVLLVNLNSNINNVQGEGSRLAFGQIVCTADAFDEVDAVRFQVEGQATAAPKGDGEASNEPLTCMSYANLIEDASG